MTTIQSRALSPLSSAQSASMLQEEFSLGSVQYILHLLWIGQALCKQTTGVVDRLCQEVQRITQGKALLILGSQDQLSKTAESVSTSQWSALRNAHQTRTGSADADVPGPRSEEHR